MSLEKSVNESQARNFPHREAFRERLTEYVFEQQYALSQCLHQITCEESKIVEWYQVSK